MQIGDLSRPDLPRGRPDCAAFQAMRFLVVIACMTAGLLALWLVQDEASMQDVMAAKLEKAVSQPQRVSPHDRTAPLQVADAVPSVPVASAEYRPTGGAEPVTGADAGSNVAASIDLSQALPFGIPEDIDVTGAVPELAGLSENPAPAAKAATDPVDLNTASLAQLNALKGGAGLGRAIIKGRPYASAEDLMKKRVVRRTAYERIKDQVAVR